MHRIIITYTNIKLGRFTIFGEKKLNMKNVFDKHQSCLHIM